MTKLGQDFEVIDLHDEDHDFKSDDFILFLGGDGTFLRCARLAYRYDMGIAGINTGTLGFLTNASQNEIDTWLTCFIKKEKRLENCPLLAMSCEGFIQEPIINDIVLHSLGAYNNFEVYYKDELIYKTSASALIIASGIGSTGINLSAYGPVIMRESHNVALTPICALLGKGYSLVVPLEAKLSIASKEAFNLEIDGKSRIDTHHKIEVYAAKKKLKHLL